MAATVSASAARERQRQEELIGQFELRRRTRNAVVPTDDSEVRAMLRNVFRVPVTLFGEDKADRRERLKREMAASVDTQPELLQRLDEEEAAKEAAGTSGGAAQQAELFYTEGSAALAEARLKIAIFSLRRAASRTKTQRGVLKKIMKKSKRPKASSGAAAQQPLNDAADADDDHEHDASTDDAFRAIASLTMGKAAKGVVRRLSNIEMEGSEVGDDRPVSCCVCSRDGGRVVTAGWSGNMRMWRISRDDGGAGIRLLPTFTKQAHEERVTGVAWHPDAGDTDTEHDDGGRRGAAAFMTASSDRSARVWDYDGELVQTFSGHLDRLAKCAFHPMGSHAATTSFDKTWRLWDVETGAELLLQEGHSRAVYTVSFHPDGSLALTAGLDAFGILWDMRTGKSCMRLEGHVKQILSSDMSPNGIFASTGSEDNTVRLWDLRQHGKELYTLPSHKSLITTCTFEKTHGRFLLTSSFDTTAALWSVVSMEPIVKLAGHEGKIMGADAVCDDNNEVVVTVSYDRTVKLWVPKSYADDDDDDDDDNVMNTMDVDT